MVVAMREQNGEDIFVTQLGLFFVTATQSKLLCSEQGSESHVVRFVQSYKPKACPNPLDPTVDPDHTQPEYCSYSSPMHLMP